MSSVRDLISELPISVILGQSEWWRTADGMPIKLTTMEPEHRRNTLAFLRRRSESLRTHHWWLLFGEAPDDVVDDAERMLEEPAEQWLERLPLIQELARLIRLDESVEGEMVGGELES